MIRMDKCREAIGLKYLTRILGAIVWFLLVMSVVQAGVHADLPPTEESIRQSFIAVLTETRSISVKAIEASTLVIAYSEEDNAWLAECHLEFSALSAERQQWLREQDGSPGIIGNTISVVFGQNGERTGCYTLEEYRNRVGPRLPSITEQQAVQAGFAALRSKYQLSDESFRLLQPLADVNYYALSDGVQRVEYYIEFWSGDKAPDKTWEYAAAIDADSGEVLAIVDYASWDPYTYRRLRANEEDQLEKYMRETALELASRTNDATTDENGVYIRDWSLEQKAEFTTKWKPVVDQFLAEYPEYARYLEEHPERIRKADDCVVYTRHLYGLPGQEDISQDDALRIAKAAIVSQLQGDARFLEQCQHVVYFFDVTNPELHLWKLHITTDGITYSPHDPVGYFVAIEARTGQVIDVFERKIDTPMYDLS